MLVPLRVKLGRLLHNALGLTAHTLERITSLSLRLLHPRGKIARME